VRQFLSILGLSPQLPSFVCQSKHFESAWYRRWAQRISEGSPDINRFGPGFAEVFKQVWDAMSFDGRAPRFRHRKMWEWCAIAQALQERGMLAPGRQGCGFAVGHEPLSSLFAACGAKILATDLHTTADQGWSAAGQHAESLENLHWPNLISWGDFVTRTDFESVDMRSMENLEGRMFDFVWSSCSFEHLGSLQAGMDFVARATRILRPGGVGIHTTEFNVSSDTETLEAGENVIYRKADIRLLADSLAKVGARLHALRFTSGSDPADLAFDEPPYYTRGRQHVKLKLGNYVCTSILLIIEKPGKLDRQTVKTAPP
jgi:SAM-dependent methyltransferase